MEWVRDNICGFGGDPARIVIFGQSSGSVAVDYWSYAYAHDPIVSGFIEHSGNAFSFGNNSPELALQHWYNAASLLGCGSSGDVLPCMRSKSTAEIEAATTKIKAPPTSNPARASPIFQPTADGVTVFENYTALSNSGKFARLVSARSFSSNPREKLLTRHPYVLRSPSWSARTTTKQATTKSPHIHKAAF